MNENLTPTKEVFEKLNCKKATFYEHQAKLNITPIKRGNKAFYNDEQIEALRQSMESVPIQTDTDGQWTDSRQTQTDSRQTPDRHSHNSEELKEHLKIELEQTKAELKEAQKQIQTLAVQVGLWEGKAQAYQELNQKLLAQSTQPAKEPIIVKPEEEPEIIEVSPEEPEAEPATTQEPITPEPPKTEEKPVKKGLFRRLFG